ncbi:MAG: YkgJ family cysteine cluster protein [Mangrovibacterium sp.]
MYRKIQRVQKVLNDAAMHTDRFSKAGGITCASRCHLCCLKKDITASPLEFFPFAYYLYKNGLAEAFYDRLEGLPPNSLCILFSSLGNRPGGCTEYEYRGLICRLFGFSSGTNKSGQKRLITCKTIKDTKAYQQLEPAHLDKSPRATDYYMRLAAIDFTLANELLQINKAIKRAIEIVLTHYRYSSEGYPA